MSGTLRPRHELLEVLASIAAYQDAQCDGSRPRWGRAGAWCIVRQGEIVKWYGRLLKRFGCPIATICRRTLNYHLAGLVRDRFLTREQRHRTNPRGTGRKLDLRPSIYKFTALGRLWIKRRGYVATNPLDHLAVQRIAQSGFNYEVNSSTSLSSAVDKAPTAPTKQTPRKTAAALTKRPSSSSRHQVMTALGKAPSRGGAHPPRGRPRPRP